MSMHQWRFGIHMPMQKIRHPINSHSTGVILTFANECNNGAKTMAQLPFLTMVPLAPTHLLDWFWFWLLLLLIEMRKCLLGANPGLVSHFVKQGIEDIACKVKIFLWGSWYTVSGSRFSILVLCDRFFEKRHQKIQKEPSELKHYSKWKTFQS
jgi:hypothetical protein